MVNNIRFSVNYIRSTNFKIERRMEEVKHRKEKMKEYLKRIIKDTSFTRSTLF